MKRTEIAELFRLDPKEDFPVQVAGWVKTSRESKNLAFIEINDGSCFKNLQVIIEANKFSGDNYKALANAPIGASILVSGQLLVTPGAKQPFEVNADEAEIIGGVEEGYPLQKNKMSTEYLRQYPHLRARTNTFGAAFRVRSETSYAIHKFFHDNGFVYVHTPLITGSDAEGAGAMFQVTALDLDDLPRDDQGKIDYTQDFFGCETHLTVSGQLEGESMAQAFGKIYTFGPTFRAERSNTTRHAAEFWMIEPEMAFSDLNDYMNTAEAMVKYCVSYLLENCPDELQFFNRFFDKNLIEKLSKVVASDFIRLPYTRAIELLEPHNDEFEYKVFWGCDLQSEHERYLTEKIYDCPVFVTDYPKEIKAFYMRLNEDGKTVAAADLLVPGIGELVGGSQREERTDVLIARMQELGMDLSSYQQYLDLRRFGSTKHAGFGLGFERFLMYVTGINNIRDVQLYPRTFGTL
ncbi:MAG: asparagine--tRNA ligase [Oscillospiraceae bacterium]|nr:asparagine--tRNA ligase [Oscillospiraceae bacterium]MBQ5343277.1 asparagine--tRNA ligase [Oscillospiraceae bacterium]